MSQQEVNLSPGARPKVVREIDSDMLKRQTFPAPEPAGSKHIAQERPGAWVQVFPTGGQNGIILADGYEDFLSESESSLERPRQGRERLVVQDH